MNLKLKVYWFAPPNRRPGIKLKTKQDVQIIYLFFYLTLKVTKVTKELETARKDVTTRDKSAQEMEKNLKDLREELENLKKKMAEMNATTTQAPTTMKPKPKDSGWF